MIMKIGAESKSVTLEQVGTKMVFTIPDGSIIFYHIGQTVKGDWSALSSMSITLNIGEIDTWHRAESVLEFQNAFIKYFHIKDGHDNYPDFPPSNSATKALRVDSPYYFY